MKLAEALQNRADLNKRIDGLESRLSDNVLIQEGSEPAEDPMELKAELDDCLRQLEDLICRINLTNAKATVDGASLTSLLARRDVLSRKIRAYQNTIDAASQTYYRTRGSEIRILPAIHVREWQKKTDELSSELRRLESSIQQANWTTELIE